MGGSQCGTGLPKFLSPLPCPFHALPLAALPLATCSAAFCSAAFSISGVTSIFAGAFWAVIGLGVAFEIGKLSAVAWQGRRNGAALLRLALAAVVPILMGAELDRGLRLSEPRPLRAARFDPTDPHH